MGLDFDLDAVFGQDYAHFAAATLDDERSDLDAAVAIERGSLVPGMRVLDAACGTGRIAVRLAAFGCRVTGVDRSAAYLGAARRAADSRGVAVELVHAEIGGPGVDGPFDAVVSWCTSLGYGDDDATREALGVLRRVLVPGGVLVIETLSHDGYVRTFTESPEAIVVEVGDDMMVDYNSFDVERGRLVTRRVTVCDAVRREVEFSVRLPTIPEWREWLTGAGCSSVAVTDVAGGAVDLDTWRIVITARA